MSDQEQLPVCALCGEAPHRGGQTVYCATVACGMTGALVTADEWRRLMARPRLAPEHVEVARRALRRAVRIGVLRSTNRVRVTRGGSRVVRLDVDDIAPGARPAEVRAALWSVMGSVETAPAPAIEAEAGAYVVVSMEDA